jgi:hypothetical protein
MNETPSSSKRRWTATSSLSPVPELPTEKAFVLHLSRDTGAELEPLSAAWSISPQGEGSGLLPSRSSAPS